MSEPTPDAVAAFEDALDDAPDVDITEVLADEIGERVAEIEETPSEEVTVTQPVVDDAPPITDEELIGPAEGEVFSSEPFTVDPSTIPPSAPPNPEITLTVTLNQLAEFNDALDRLWRRERRQLSRHVLPKIQKLRDYIRAEYERALL